jgi:hypothetical protein
MSMILQPSLEQIRQIEAISSQVAAGKIDPIHALGAIVLHGGMLVGSVVPLKEHRPGPDATICDGVVWPQGEADTPASGIMAPVLRASTVVSTAVLSGVLGNLNVYSQRGNAKMPLPGGIVTGRFGWEYNLNTNGYYDSHMDGDVLRALQANPQTITGGVDVVVSNGVWRPIHHEPGHFGVVGNADTIARVAVTAEHALALCQVKDN